MASKDLEDALASTQLLFLDADGVLTDGRLLYDGAGGEYQRFHVRDGFAVRVAQREGIRVAILSGRRSAAVSQRAAELGIERVEQGCRDKGPAVEAMARAAGCSLAACAFLGDDLPDVPAMTRCGLPMAVADAEPAARAAARLVTDAPGGGGAVREAIERCLRARGRWEAVLAAYGATAGQ